MATTPIEHIESLRVGSVIFVSPSEIKIRLDAEAPDSVALNTGLPVKFPRVNNYLIIPSDCAYVVCQVVWAQLVQVEVGSSFDKSIVGLPRSSRILSLSPLGMLAQGDKGLRFTSVTSETKRKSPEVNASFVAVGSVWHVGDHCGDCRIAA